LLPTDIDPRLTIPRASIGELITTEERELIQLRDVTCGGSWEALRDILQKSGTLSAKKRHDDLRRICFLESYEATHGINLMEFPPDQEGDPT